MTTTFHDQMCVLMQDYVDNLLTKSLETSGHLAILDNIFKRLEEYKLRLNPNKCVFSVQSGKLLGYIVSHKGIEVDPAKVKAILDMLPPTIIS